MNILLYNGPGSSSKCVQHTLSAIRPLLSKSYDVIPVNSSVLLNEPWEESTALLIFPGGRDLPYCHDLNGKGTQRIKKYVENGGKYLGICAGAYWACEKIEFELKTNMEVTGRRELGFCLGTARGSVWNGFEYNSEKGARAAGLLLNLQQMQEVTETTATGISSLTIEKGPTSTTTNANSEKEQADLHVYFNGGPYFQLRDCDNCITLASYHKPPDEWSADFPLPAIVECHVGKGKAVLSGVHLEYSARKLNREDYPDSDIIEKLTASDLKRVDLLRRILRDRLGLRVDLSSAPDGKNIEQETDIYLTSSDDMEFRQVSSAFKNQADNDMVIKDSTSSFVVSDCPPSCPKSQSTLSSFNLLLLPPRLSTPPTKFNPSSFYSYCTSFYPILLFSNSTPSTQTLLDKNSKIQDLLPSGSVFTSWIQTAGRGRGRNSWVGNEGCLQFSLLTRAKIGQRCRSSKDGMTEMRADTVVFLQYIMALAVVKAIRSLIPDFPIFIKWPNDVYVKTRIPSPSGEEQSLKKIGGILVNSSFTSPYFTFIIGCGVNISNAQPTISLNQVLYSNPEWQTHFPFTHEQTLALVVSTFEALLNECITLDGFKDSLLEEYYKYWLHSNQSVVLETHNNHPAKIIGIDSSGYLVARSTVNHGEIFHLSPDGNGFDMMRGLIVRKL